MLSENIFITIPKVSCAGPCADLSLGLSCFCVSSTNFSSLTKICKINNIMLI